MIFSSREDVQKATKQYHLHRHHEFCNEETKSRTYAIRCKDIKSNCKWRLHASRGKGSDIWKITRYNRPHTCVNPSLSQYHKQLDSKFISDFILAIVREQPSVKIGALQSKIKDKNPESMFFIEDDPFFVNNRLDLAYRVFDRMFWAYKQTIEGFKNCRPVIFIDSTFLYGKHKGCLFCATTLDSSNHIFSIAWAIVDSENTRNLDWFMSCLRVFVTDHKGICVISDRHIAIKKCVDYLDTRRTTLCEQLQMGFKFTPACRQILLDNLNEQTHIMSESLTAIVVNLKFGREDLKRSMWSNLMKGYAHAGSFKKHAFHVPM
ncbi:uncharacterized protein LOC131175819 [Hevea brasiliensis]|uniref:uncharacterized protein LOC131175819 n=1 Tax=Hevea brasiliensis TaxID=3981 RepID=UPI0025D5FAD2|nr:uncharacterized protein LOC131175819 [Hevea brasiliensis]